MQPVPGVEVNFFEKPWLPAGNINQLETTSQAVLSPAQSASLEKLHHD